MIPRVIQTEAEYEEALAQFELLVAAIEDYEARGFGFVTPLLPAGVSFDAAFWDNDDDAVYDGMG